MTLINNMQKIVNTGEKQETSPREQESRIITWLCVAHNRALIHRFWCTRGDATTPCRRCCSTHVCVPIAGPLACPFMVRTLRCKTSVHVPLNFHLLAMFLQEIVLLSNISTLYIFWWTLVFYNFLKVSIFVLCIISYELCSYIFCYRGN